jgi:VAD1 Analog of StAR-related lipid transfer domain
MFSAAVYYCSFLFTIVSHCSATACRYVHPFTAPMGPQQTRTVKSQRLKRFGANGLILQTTTHLEDIMMSDYFQIEDT